MLPFKVTQSPWKKAFTQKPNGPSSTTIVSSMATDRTTTTIASPQRRTMSAFEVRASLVFALASQASSLSQRLLTDLVTETVKYAFPRKVESRNLEEALMLVPDLETVNFKVLSQKDEYEIREVEVLSQKDEYEIREVEPYYIAVTTMPGKTGFDFNGSSKSFNVLAEYLFGKNTSQENMEMTAPVFTRKSQSVGEKMEMTTPVMTKRAEDEDKWQMSFVLPSKYAANFPLPKDPNVSIKEVPRKVVAVVAFSGFVTDEEVKSRESRLRVALKNDKQFQVKEGALVEVAQYNPPFTLPFTRRNEVALEVEMKQE